MEMFESLTSFFKALAMRVVAACLLIALVGFVNAADFKLDIERSLDLTTPLVREEVFYEVTNTGSKSLASFQVTIATENLSEWSVLRPKQKARGKDAELEAVPHAVVETREVNGKR
jgi:uncharacterized protein with FMN-binding domain